LERITKEEERIMGFEFLAIVRNGPDSSMYRLVLDSELREEMARTFTTPVAKWQDAAVMKTTFDPAYHLADKEIFEIKQFKLSPEMLNALRFPQEYDEFNVDTQGTANIKAIVAVNAEESNITAIFKLISKAKKLQPTKNLMLVCKRKEFAKLTEPGIILDERITAVYTDGALLFKSPGTVKQILSLKEYMKEANDLEVLAFLEERFETDSEKILAVADSWMRKRFAALMQSKLFDERSALDIYETAKSFSAEIPMELSKDRLKLILPEEKQDIKMILKFLNEEYYKGVLTGNDYQTQSKRPLQNPETAFGAPQRKGGRRFGR
jgi:hypothetical protein